MYQLEDEFTIVETPDGTKHRVWSPRLLPTREELEELIKRACPQKYEKPESGA